MAAKLIAAAAVTVGAAAGVCDAGDSADAACAPPGEADPTGLLQLSRTTRSELGANDTAPYAKAFAACRRGAAAFAVPPSLPLGHGAAPQSKGFGGKHCKGTRVDCGSQTAVLVEERKSSQYAAWYAMKPQNMSLMTGFHKSLTEVPTPEELATLTQDTVTIAEGSAADVARMMFEATKVPGVSEHLPRELRGIYWMKGNPIPEELMAIQYGQWHEDEGLMVLPLSPFMWSWAGGKPKDAPSDFYTEDRTAAVSSAQTLIIAQNALSAKFETCKAGRGHTRQPLVCDTTDREDELAYANLQLHQFANLTEVVDFGPLLALIAQSSFLSGASGAWTMQKQRNAKGGTAWRRVTQWGACKECADVEAGSYDMVKVIDADGNIVQPWYDEFVKYMGDVPLVTWSGWKDAAARDKAAEIQDGYVKAVQAGEAQKLMPVEVC